MGFKETLYSKAPVSLQNAMVSLYGWTWKKRRFGGIFEQEYKSFKDREGLTKTEWNNYSNTRLNAIVKHAYNSVPFYSEKWKAAGINASNIDTITIDKLNGLPFLEKDELRQYGKTSLLANKLEKSGSFFASSGTTGTPTSILFSETMHQRWSAGFEARIRNWAGLSRHNSRGMIGGRRVLPGSVATPPYYRYNIFEKQVYFSAYHISAQSAPDYLEGIKKYALDYMTGYAVSNSILANFFKELQLQAPQLQAVITSSEKLTPEMKSLFTEVYGCKTFDSYSGVEACGLISECEEGSLHISPDVGIIEFLNEQGNNANPGELAEMVCTGFLNYDQPLIRYRIGDYGILDDKTCKCGREMPVVKEIIGRHEDIIVGKDGRAMVRFHGIFINLPVIEKGQVIQETISDFTIKVVVQRKLSLEEKETMRKRMTSQLGDVNVNIMEVDEIPLSPNGKYRAVVSNLKTDFK